MNVIILSELMESGAGASIECSLFGSGLLACERGTAESSPCGSTRIESSRVNLPAVGHARVAAEDRVESTEPSRR